jgi:3',5'-cyclic AMP phosphodiesterase CpdA
MSSLLCWLKQPAFFISVSAVAFTALLSLSLSSLLSEDEAQATVSPEPPSPDPAPRPVAPAQSAPIPVGNTLGFAPIAGDPFAPWPEDGRETLLTFVQLSDTHVGRGKDHEAFASAIRVINRMDPQPTFVMITGDLTDSFTKAQIKLFKKLYNRIKATTYLVPGNHDVMFNTNASRISWWEREFPSFKTPYRVDVGPMALVGIDSQLWNARRKSRSADKIADQQWDEMERLVTAATDEGKRVFIFDHIPPMPTFYRQRIARSWKSDRMRDYLSLIKAQGVEADLSGHVHRDELYVEGKTLFLNAPPISEKYTRLASMRLFRVTPQGLTYRQIYLRRRGKHLSYQMDLHGVDEASYDRWVNGMDDASLAKVWQVRHAGERDVERWFPRIDKKRFRSYLLDPFDHQPQRGMNTRFSKLRLRRGSMASPE